VLSSNGDRDIVTKSAGRVTLSVESDRVALWCTPPIFIDASWPAANMDLYGVTYDLKTGAADASVTKGEGWGWMNYVPEAKASIEALVRTLVAGTKLATRGYDPFADPDLLSTLSGIGDKLVSLPSSGGRDAGGGVAAGDLQRVSAGGTVAVKGGIRIEEDAGGIDIPGGGEVTFELRGAGSVADVAGAEDPQGIANAISVQAIDVRSESIVLLRGGKPIARLRDVTIARGGAVTLSSFSLEGKAATAAGIEALIRLVGGALDASSRGAPDGLAWEMGARGADPTITTGVTKSMVEKALTEAVRRLVLEHHAAIPGVNLAEALGIEP
jgi:hypothetical protein